MTQDALPLEAETFLARLMTLPDTAWDEILARSRLGARSWLRVLWRAFRDATSFPFRRRHAAASGFAFSDAALARFSELVKARAFPERLGPRGLALVHMTVQAICSRAALTPQRLSRAYAPFERFIPFASLTEPDNSSTGSGGA